MKGQFLARTIKYIGILLTVIPHTFLHSHEFPKIIQPNYFITLAMPANLTIRISTYIFLKLSKGLQSLKLFIVTYCNV